MNSTLDLTRLSDLELLKLLCTTDEDEECYVQFLKRFWEEVNTECVEICRKRKLDPHIGSEIAHETFDRVRKYKSFKEDGIRLADEHKAILVYLFRIVRRQFYTYHAKTKKEEVVHKSYFDDIVSAVNGNIDAGDLQCKKELSIKILKKLNPKEQRVLLTDMEHKRHQKYLPDDVLDILAEELTVKKDTVRKIRERAINKINKAIDEINQN